MSRQVASPLIGEVSLAVVRVRWGFASEDRCRGSPTDLGGVQGHALIIGIHNEHVLKWERLESPYGALAVLPR
jgi:hypothetical protein